MGLHINNISEIKKMGALKSYKLIVELAADAIFIKDLESRYILVNKKALEAFGNLPRGKVIGKNDNELLPPDQAKVNIEDDQKVFRTGRPVEITKKMTAGDKVFYFQAVKTPLKNEKGNVIGLIGIARDITKRKHMDDVLHMINEAFLNFNSNPDDNIKRLVETTGTVLGGTCTLYNKEEGAFLCTIEGWNIPKDFKRKDNKEGHICHDVIISGKEEPFIINGLDKTQYAKTDPNVNKYGLKTYLGSVVKINGNVAGALCVVYQEDKEFDSNLIEILSILAKAIGVEEERKFTLEALQVSERKFRAVFDNANDGILLAELGSNKFYIGNNTICHMLGYTPDEVKNLGIKDIHPKEDLHWIMKQVRKQARVGISVSKDIPVKRKDGSIFYADINGSPITIEGKRYLMGIFRDITERKETERMLKDSEAQLKEQKLSLEQKNIALREIVEQIEIEKNRIKDDIASNISKLIFPLLTKLKTKKNPRNYIDLLQHHLEDLTSSFGRKITEKSVELTARELEICGMVKGGLTSKEISDLLEISYQTVENHRKNIRKKLKLSNKRVNLTSFLQKF